MGAAAALVPMLGPAVLGAVAAARSKPKPEANYPDVPTIYDPSVYGAGDNTQRRATTSGQAMGKKWSAEDFVTSMPMLMGR